MREVHHTIVPLCFAPYAMQRCASAFAKTAATVLGERGHAAQTPRRGALFARHRLAAERGDGRERAADESAEMQCVGCFVAGIDASPGR